MDFSLRPLESVRAVVGVSQPFNKSPKVSGEGFQEAMVKALKETSALQMESGRLSKELSLDNPTVGLEETMLAGVKSNIAFQSTLQVRNRVLQAYNDIMNMQI